MQARFTRGKTLTVALRLSKLRAIAMLANFNLCAKEIFALIDSTDVTHFYYGETYTAIDELQRLCGEKISASRASRRHRHYDFHFRHYRQAKGSVALRLQYPKRRTY